MTEEKSFVPELILRPVYFARNEDGVQDEREGVTLNPNFLDCPDCDGGGAVECDLGHEHECDGCDGEGTVPDDSDPPRPCGWAIVRANYYRELRIVYPTQLDAEVALAALKELPRETVTKWFTHAA